MLNHFKSFAGTLPDDKNTGMLTLFGRLALVVFLVLMPVAYDRAVPEVSGDMRWTLVHLTAGSLLTLIALFYTFRKKLPPLNLTGITYAVVALMAWVSISTAFSFDPYSAKQELFNQLSYMGLFLVIVFFRDLAWYRTLLWVLAVPLAFNCILAIIQFAGITDDVIRQSLAFWPERVIDYFRPAAPPAGTMSNKNLLGSYLALSLPVLAMMSLCMRSLNKQLIAGFVFALATTTFVYTRSRGSWVALAAAVLLFSLWLALDKTLRSAVKEAVNKRALGIFALALAVTAAASFYQSPLKGFHSIDKSVTQQVGTIVKMSHGDFGTRYAYNLNGLKMFLDNPITGWGLGSFHKIYPKYNHVWMETPRVGFAIDARPQRAHNDWLEAFIELGVLGGLLLVGIFVSSLWVAFRLVHNASTKPQDKVLFAGIAVGLVALGINALGDFPLQMPTAPILMWTFMGMLTGAFMLVRKQSPRPWPQWLAVPLQKVPFATPAVMLAVTALAGGTTYAMINDDLQYRNANRYLKVVMYDVRNNVYNDNTRRYIDQAFALYPHHHRMQEFRAVVYANYADGTKTMALDTKMAAVADTLKNDPYAPNNLVNMGGLYMLKLAELITFNAPREEVTRVRDEGLAIAERTIAVAPFSSQAYVIPGFLHLYTRNLPEAIKYLTKAVEIDPTSQAAQGGLAMAKSQADNSGWIKVGPAQLDKL